MRKNKKKPPKNYKKIDRIILSLLVTLLLSSFFWIQEKAYHVELPSSGNPIEFYATDIHDHLSESLASSILSAQKAIVLAIYNLTDQKIIQALNQKAQQGIKIKIICDAAECPNLAKKLHDSVQIIKRFGKGIMHLKILVIDEEQTWVGSANFTYDSLHLNPNLMIAFEGKEIAAYALEKLNSFAEYGHEKKFPYRRFQVGDQELEFWFLPDNNQAAIRIKKLIESAQKTIQIAMYTFTRYDLANALYHAQKRGVKVEVVLDCAQSCKTNLNIINKFIENKIPYHISSPKPIMHHKFMLVDGKTLVNGSANWTKKAFTVNDDCFTILSPLTQNQQETMDKIWRQVLKETR